MTQYTNDIVARAEIRERLGEAERERLGRMAGAAAIRRPAWRARLAIAIARRLGDSHRGIVTGG